MIKQVIQLIIIVTAALYCGMAGAHGKVSMDEDTCARRLDDDSMVHLSAYQPQHEPSNQYCTEIPREGNTLLVIDLADQALRDIPVGIRVVRGTSEVDDETVAYLRPSYHPDGVIRGETSLDKGLYTVFITGEAVPPVHYEYSLRVQMINYANIFRAATGPLIALLLLSLLGYKLMKSERVQVWRASTRRASRRRG
ncbi:hypothetical protein [Nitrosovibrio sp. Nv6]|uniref:hypothetical protein n=1 Tax=Nitrosovibrio sp. Nv6 TaxID=1855340 RepID=UPI0008BC5807|nr:hypothetical protein [Nitrosovibrio sp. Nv6]SEP20303.1 hypothetical protein SAMN05216316_2000 [Nitrosovibrio sp. Nv6]